MNIVAKCLEWSRSFLKLQVARTDGYEPFSNDSLDIDLLDDVINNQLHCLSGDYDQIVQRLLDTNDNLLLTTSDPAKASVTP